jgi:hypothetical protein
MDNPKLSAVAWSEYNQTNYNKYGLNSGDNDTKVEFLDEFMGHARFASDAQNVAEELIDLLISKHHDYGPKNIAQSPGGALNGLRVRLWDKLARLNNLVDTNADPEHESLEDTFKDMANYAIIGLLVLRGKWDTE